MKNDNQLTESELFQSQWRHKSCTLVFNFGYEHRKRLICVFCLVLLSFGLSDL